MFWKYTLVRVTQNISSMSVKSTGKSIACPPYTLKSFACHSIYYTSISRRTSLNFCWSFGQSVIDGFWFVKTITEDSFSFFFLGIFSGVTLLVYLLLVNCNIRFFVFLFAIIEGSLKVFSKPGWLLFYCIFIRELYYFGDTL